jgi:carbonic anhydrase/acetyltransferase-like protein (isoleucine patch superfamily)
MNGNILNKPENISIGNHCWIGLGVLILKGAKVPNNCIIGAKSIYTKKSNQENENVIFVGSPAKVIKTGVNWNILKSDYFLEEMSKTSMAVERERERERESNSTESLQISKLKKVA